MRKKRLIIISVILSVLAVMIILASTVFMLQKVEVSFLTSNNAIVSASDSNDIIKSGKFNYGGNVLFMNFDKQVARIETAYPYVKVEKIERKFPNKAIIHISERKPIAYVESENYTYVLDKDLKILNVVYKSEYNDLNNSLPALALNIPQLTGFEIPKGCTVGTKISKNEIASILSATNEGLARSSCPINLLQKIDIDYHADGYLLLSFKINELSVIIKGSSDLSMKVQIGIQSYLKYLEELDSNETAVGVIEQNSVQDIRFTHHS